MTDIETTTLKGEFITYNSREEGAHHITHTHTHTHTHTFHVKSCGEAPRSAMRQKEQRGNYGPGPLLWFSGEGMGEAR